MAETDDGQQPALALERYGEAVAHVTHFRKADLAEVIERLGIRMADFQDAQKAWTSAIGDELQRGEMALALRLGEAFAAAREQLAAANPTLTSIGPRASERAKALSQQDPVPPGMRHFTSLQETQLATDVPNTPALPFAPAGSTALFPPPNARQSPIPEGMRGLVSLTGTELAPDEPPEPAWPFGRSHVPAPEPEQAPPPDDVSHAPFLSLEQHAGLCAELALNPANRSTILRHYGLNELQRQQLDALWGTRMQNDPRLRAAWEQLCTAQRTQLLQSTRLKR